MKNPTREQLKKKIDKFLQCKDFQKKYLKNIVADICHGQSLTARIERCNICNIRISEKERRKMDAYSYGISFAQLYNKRHKKSKKYYPCKRYFCCLCLTCLGLVESSLDFRIQKSYAS